MTQPDTPQAMLLVMHEDILLPEQLDDRSRSAEPDQENMVIPTRTITSSQYPLTKEICRIGRDPTCEVRVRSHRTDISRKHATIKREGTVFTIYDHSRYGTYVNNQKINSLCRLDTDDIIGFANSREMLCFVNGGLPLRTAPQLTDRERDVLRLVAVGRLNKEIAEELTITLNTVHTHLKSIYEKLEVHNRTEAVNQARKLRLL